MNTLKAKINTILIVFATTIISGVAIMHWLPKFIKFLFNNFGVTLNSGDLTTKYLMGITVRIIGILLCLQVIKFLNVKLFKLKISKEHFLISWMFFIYILTNIEISAISLNIIHLVILMVIDTIFVGLFEELIFRGFLLNLMLKHWGQSLKGIYFSAGLISIAFGLMHLANISSKNYVPVLSQVFYATIIGLFFAAVYIRTNGDFIWCAILHTLFNIGSTFGDLATIAEKTNNIVVPTAVDIVPYIIECSTFIPLMIFSIFLLRKAKWVSQYYIFLK